MICIFFNKTLVTCLFQQKCTDPFSMLYENRAVIVVMATVLNVLMQPKLMALQIMGLSLDTA